MLVKNQSITRLAYPVLILLLAAFLSFFALENARRFHPDEAFYMTFARNAAINGDWLLISETVDKPPLTFYSNALALIFFANESDSNGVLQLAPLKGEFAGRIPATLMSIILVAVLMRIAHTFSGTYSAVYLVGMLTALSPLRIVFAPTAFTDMPMLLFGIISLWMAIQGRWGWSGMWFIVSISAKPQIIFYLPLIVSLLIFDSYKTKTLRFIPQKIVHFALPIILGIVFLWGWDSLRMLNRAESFYQLGQARYSTTGFAPFPDYTTRFWALWATNQYLFGQALLTIFLICIALLRIILAKRISINLTLLWGWIIGFMGIHIVLTLNLFDRNQIILLPIVALAVGIPLSANPSTAKYKVILKVAQFALGFAMLFFSFQVAHGILPIGGDDGRHAGIDILANYLNSKPVATVIYDTWLDWELDYYMGQWTDKRRVFYPNPELLVEGALALDEDEPRYLVVPRNVDVALWLDALETAQFIISLDYELDNFLVYSLMPN